MDTRLFRISIVASNRCAAYSSHKPPECRLTLLTPTVLALLANCFLYIAACCAAHGILMRHIGS